MTCRCTLAALVMTAFPYIWVGREAVDLPLPCAFCSAMLCGLDMATVTMGFSQELVLFFNLV